MSKHRSQPLPLAATTLADHSDRLQQELDSARTLLWLVVAQAGGTVMITPGTVSQYNRERTSIDVTQIPPGALEIVARTREPT